MTRRDFLWTACGASMSAQSPVALLAGFTELYHLRFAEARTIFAQWRAHQPDDPMGEAAEAASHLVEEFEQHAVLTADFFLDDARLLGGITGTANVERTQAFERACDRAVRLGESASAKNPRDANAWLALTIAAGMRADYASLIAKRQIESLKLIRQAEGHAGRLLAVAPQMGDGYMALGAASYILACLPFYKRAVLFVGGLQGNKQRGLEELERAAKTGLYLAPYAKMMLGLALLREHRTEEARRLVAELVVQFPRSPLFAREQVRMESLRR